MADFLQLEGKLFLVLGAANRKSVAWAIGSTLEEAGATVLHSVRSEARRASLGKLMNDRTVYCCDVEFEEQIAALGEQLQAEGRRLDGFVHSIAFADYSDGFHPFHETRRDRFLQATAISSFSLVDLARHLKPVLQPDAAVVAIGISSYVTAENYGYMAPIKASLETSSRFLAKSFSADTRVRFNTVNAGPLKTSASAGIPGYAKSYLYAEKLTLRKAAVSTQEVADVAVWLLSPRSSGVNGQGIVVNAGMDFNYFDKEIIEKVMEVRSP